MAPPFEIPLFRRGRWCPSQDRLVLNDQRTGAPVAEVSLAPAAMVRDSASVPVAHERRTARQLQAFADAAAGHLLGDVEIGGSIQSRESYVSSVSAVSGLPRVWVEASIQRLAAVLTAVGAPAGNAAGDDRPGDDDHVGDGHGDGRETGGTRLVPQSGPVALVLPGNTPSAHASWLPIPLLGFGVVARPSLREPFTPARLLAALSAAGLADDRWRFLPSDHRGAHDLIAALDRSVVYGGTDTVSRWTHDRRVLVHGPGHSAVVLDCPPSDRMLDVIVESVLYNAGRACVAASTVAVVGGGARQIGERLAERLHAIEPCDLDDPDAALASTTPVAASALDSLIERGLAAGGATEVTAGRGPRRGRVQEGAAGCFVLPTVVRCPPGHPLARRELPMPYVSVVGCEPDELLAHVAPSTSVTLSCTDATVVEAVGSHPGIAQVQFGAMPTSKFDPRWPGDGDLHAHLFARRRRPPLPVPALSARGPEEPSS